MARTINNTEFVVYSASAITVGYGHKRIQVELLCEGYFQKFSAVTTDMRDFDRANDLDDRTERYEALYDIIANDIEDAVAEWIETI